MQRLRIKFCRGEEVRFISHLDMVRLWHRAFRRAGVPLAYSEGFNPHPRISLAAPLAIGVTGEAELMEIAVARPVSPHWLSESVNRALPAGVTIIQVLPVPLTQPAVQAQVSMAEYRIELKTEKTAREIQVAIDRLLEAETLPWQHQRDTGVRTYDLRPLVKDLWLEDSLKGVCTLGMVLRCDTTGSGRPEQVAAALGLAGPPHSIHRIKLVLNAV